MSTPAIDHLTRELGFGELRNGRDRLQPILSLSSLGRCRRCLECRLEDRTLLKVFWESAIISRRNCSHMSFQRCWTELLSWVSRLTFRLSDARVGLGFLDVPSLRDLWILGPHHCYSLVGLARRWAGTQYILNLGGSHQTLTWRVSSSGGKIMHVLWESGPLCFHVSFKSQSSLLVHETAVSSVSSSVSPISRHLIQVKILLPVESHIHATIIDSRSSGSIMNEEWARHLGITWIPLPRPVSDNALE